MFEWPLDKVGIINSALSQTGDQQVTTADDGSDEWTTASPAYERALAYMLEDHSWGSATQVRTLQPTGTAPADSVYDTAFALPTDLVHLIWVRLNGVPASYDLLNNQIVLLAMGQQPVTVKGVFSTNSDPQNQSPTFVLALTTFVMSGIYRGLHEDAAEADKLWAFADALLQRAKTRYDQQKPKQAPFNSRMAMARRVRRPWLSWPPGWGGTGWPS